MLHGILELLSELLERKNFQSDDQGIVANAFALLVSCLDHQHSLLDELYNFQRD